jgi:hypothetical protein
MNSPRVSAAFERPMNEFVRNLARGAVSPWAPQGSTEGPTSDPLVKDAPCGNHLS